MANVFDVADFFIQFANQSEDDQITNPKLNKLLYYAQGAFLARTGKPLFHNRIEAWAIGPVIPDVYHKYEMCGKNPIPYDQDAIDPSCFTPAELETLFDVMCEFGQYTGSKLISLIQSPGTPWSDATDSGKAELDQAAIKNYFVDHPVPFLKERTNIPQVDKLPADWYDPNEDSVWEEYLSSLLQNE